MIFKKKQVFGISFSQFFLLGILIGTLAIFPFSGVGFTLPKVLIYAVTAAFGMGWLFLYADVRPLRMLWSHPIGWSFSAFFVILFLSIAWSTMPLISIFGADPRMEGILTYAIYFSLLLCVLCLVQQSAGERNIFRAVIWSNAAVVLYGFFQFIDIDPLRFLWDGNAFLNRTFSLLGQPNTLGTFIVLTLPFVALGVHQSKKWRRILLILLCAFNIVVLLGTASRAALLGFIVMFALYVFLMPSSVRKHVKGLTQVQKTILIWLGLCLFIIGYVSFLQRFSMEAVQGRSLLSRQIIWSDTMQMIVERPQGYGLETMGTIYPRFKSRALHEVEPILVGVDRAHSKPLDLMVTLGPLGLIAYYAFIFFLLKAAIVNRKKKELLAGGIGILGYSVTLLFGFDTIVTAVFFWIIAGWMMGKIWSGKKKEITAWLRIIPAFLCVMSVCASVVFLQWSLQRFRLQAAEHLFEQGYLSNSVAQFEEAAILFPFDRTLLVRFTETSLVASEYAPEETSRAVFLSISDRTLKHLDFLTSQQDGMVPLLRAWNAALIPDVDKLKQYITTAKILMPNTIDTHRIAARSFRMVGDTVAAKKAELDLLFLLPTSWNDHTSDAGRIMRKENPWLEEFTSTPNPSSTGGGE